MAHKSFGEKMAGKGKKSKSASLDPAKRIKPEEKIKAARKMLLDMKERLLAEGFWEIPFRGSGSPR
jgi:hypothetical protein